MAYVDYNEIDALYAAWQTSKAIRDRNQLIEKIIPFAEDLARECLAYREPRVRTGEISHSNLDRQDLTNEAVISAIGAVDAFDPAIGRPFGEFVKERMAGKVRDFERRNRTVFGRYQKDAPWVDSIEHLTGVYEARGDDFQERLPVLSLDEPIADDEDCTWKDVIADTNDYFAALENAMYEPKARPVLEGHLEAALAVLTEQERTIIVTLYSPDLPERVRRKTPNREEAGKFLGLTRERVRQIEVKALVKMKAVFPEAEARDFLDFASRDRVSA
jgi:RNA polymerase sigma factor (sigma-70 family)